MASSEIFSRLERSITSLDLEQVKKETQDALAAGITPQDIIALGLAKGMTDIGDKFERRECYLPELMLSARSMKEALGILQPQMMNLGAEPAGRIVLGTVQGDLHDVGKNILGAVLQSEGFEVCDLGIDVPPDEFAAKAIELDADVVGLSALVSIAVSKMAETIMVLRERDVPAKVIIGGAATSQETADSLGADAYGKDAWQGAGEIKRLVQLERVK